LGAVLAYRAVVDLPADPALGLEAGDAAGLAGYDLLICYACILDGSYHLIHPLFSLGLCERPSAWLLSTETMIIATSAGTDAFPSP